MTKIDKMLADAWPERKNKATSDQCPKINDRIDPLEWHSLFANNPIKQREDGVLTCMDEPIKLNEAIQHKPTEYLRKQLKVSRYWRKNRKRLKGCVPMKCGFNEPCVGNGMTWGGNWCPSCILKELRRRGNKK